MAIGFGSSSSINGLDEMLDVKFFHYRQAMFVRSKMERSDFAMSRVKKKRREISSVRS